MVWVSSGYPPLLDELIIRFTVLILLVFVQHNGHRIMRQREDVCRAYRLITRSDGCRTASLGHVHRLPLPPPVRGEGEQQCVSLQCMISFYSYSRETPFETPH